MDSVFSIPVRVYYEDTDAGGVVYYANYLKFMERARTEWLRSLGFGQEELARDPGVVFAVRSATLEFLKPARLDDVLAVSAGVTKAARVSLTIAQQVRRGTEILCEGETRIVCLDARRFAPVAIPDRILERLQDKGAAA